MPESDNAIDKARILKLADTLERRASMSPGVDFEAAKMLRALLEERDAMRRKAVCRELFVRDEKLELRRRYAAVARSFATYTEQAIKDATTAAIFSNLVDVSTSKMAQKIEAAILATNIEPAPTFGMDI